MQHSLLVNATEIAAWADQISSRAVLPRLISLLVAARTSPKLLDFRTGEGVQLPGWDGISDVEHANAFCPSGLAGWEMGTDKSVGTKANDDFSKRSANPEEVDPQKATFVFVTPRRWSQKRKWAAAKKAEGRWADVRALDADDLETWLLEAPSVHLWLSKIVGKSVPGAAAVSDFWKDWSGSTSPPTPIDLVLAGRKECADAIRSWLAAPSGILHIRGESKEEALAIAVASAETMPSNQKLRVSATSIVVSDDAALQHLSGSKSPLTFILSSKGALVLTHALSNGHAVIVPLATNEPISGSCIEIPRIALPAAAESLKAAGLQDHADELAKLARRSLLSFRRKTAIAKGLKIPKWADPASARDLIPALLVGKWNDTSPGDQQLLERLAGKPYKDFQASMVRWSREENPPLRRIGSVWYLVDHEDAWSLLSSHLLSEDLQSFSDAIIEVLSAFDPKFDLPVEKQWMASSIGHQPPYSAEARGGLTDSLALMGSRVSEDPALALPERVAFIVREILSRANRDWRIWATLSNDLSLIAEASPDEFLIAVEAGLSQSPSPVMRLFENEGNVMFSSTPHVGLLNALETIAWSRDHLSRGSLVLAELAHRDPGGRIANRPENSLRDIFLLWHPQTAASLDQRISILELLLQRMPAVGWKLLMRLLPEQMGTASFNPKPSWRDWAPDGPPRVLRTEHAKGITEVVQLALRHVGNSGDHWSDIIKALPAFPEGEFKATVQKLNEITPEAFPESDRTTIWNSIRALVSQHRSFPTAEWSMKGEKLPALDDFLSRFEPKDTFGRYGWLFGPSPRLPEGGDEDYEATRAAIETRRHDAITVVFAEGGIEKVLSLIPAGPFQLGISLGRSTIDFDRKALIIERLSATNEQDLNFARGLAGSTAESMGREWMEAFVRETNGKCSASVTSELMLALPSDDRTWNLATEIGAEAESCYWASVHPWTFPGGFDKTRAMKKLIEAGRPFSSLSLFNHKNSSDGVESGLIVEALEAALSADTTKDRPDQMFSYIVPDLFRRLEESTFDKARLARLEVAYLQILGDHHFNPALLHKELSADPAFFVELIKTSYRADNSEKVEASDEDAAKAAASHEILRSWKTMPGMLADGTLDGEQLARWVHGARAKLSEANRVTSGDHAVGEMFSYSPIGPDSVWPHPTVRDLAGC